MSVPDRLRAAGLHSALAGPFDLAIARGECVAVTGPSGSGKSLFLRMLADLDPNRGEVWLDGQERRGFTPPAWRRRVVYCPADSGWWEERVAAHYPGAALAAARILSPRFGLVDGLLEPLYVQAPCYVMSPVSMIKRPWRWLQALSRLRATHTQGPNFAYQMCLDRDEYLANVLRAGLKRGFSVPRAVLDGASTPVRIDVRRGGRTMQTITTSFLGPVPGEDHR